MVPVFDDPNLDPGVEGMARRVLAAVDRLETASIRVERTVPEDLWSEPTPVTEGLIAAVAEMPNASHELKDYSARVAAGECRWPDIEMLARPIPPEVAEFKNSPSYIWGWGASLATPEAPVSGLRARQEENTVGPSDWPDDLDEYPTNRSWLV